MNWWHKINILREIFNECLIWLTCWIVMVLSSIIIIGVTFWGEKFQKATGLAAEQTQKHNRIFGGRFFAQLQSVAISQWSLCFLHLAVCFKKNNESDRSDKKTTTRRSWIKSAHNRLGWLARTVNSCPITQWTCTHACQCRLQNQRLGWLIGGHAHIRQEQASPLMFQALNHWVYILRATTPC